METQRNFELFASNIAKYDVLNNCVKLEEDLIRPIYEHSLEDSVEEENAEHDLNNIISTRGEIVSNTYSLAKVEELKKEEEILAFGK